VVRSIGVADLRDALASGVDDFRAMPTHVLFLSLIYPLIGLGLLLRPSGTISSRCSIRWRRVLR
jgi:uncharacterized membrane protein